MKFKLSKLVYMTKLVLGCRVAHVQTLSCSSSSEEKSPMVFSTDPKQHKNNWNDDISLFSAPN